MISKMHEVPSYGPKNAKIMIVGEAPGAEEEKRKVPFIGAAGRLLDQLLSQAGIIRRECFVTNVIKIRPPNNKINVFLDLTRKEVKKTEVYDYYVDELKKEIELIKPNVIIALGNVPLFALTGLKGINKRRGSVYESTLVPGVKVLATLHPSGVLRSGSYLNKHLLFHDLTKAKEESAFPEIRRVEANYHINPSFNEVMTFLKRIKEGMTIAFDIEVVRLEVSHLSIAISEEEVMSIPFYKSGDNYFTLEHEVEIWREIERVLGNEKVKKIGQNIIFDFGFLFRKYGMIVRNIEDTMVQHGILYPEFPKGLDFLTSMYTDHPYYKDEGKKYMKIGGSDDEFSLYNAKDSLMCMKIFPVLKAKLEKQENEKTYEKQRDLIPILITMQEFGIKMDVEAIERERREVSAKLAELQAELDELAGEPLNISSSKQLKEFFYEKRGMKRYVNRKTGKPTVDETALKRLSRLGSDEAKIILKMRKLRKYLETYLNMPLDEDGRLRTSFNPVGTKSGRLSSSKSIFGTGGNIQNDPPEFKKFMLFDDDYVGYNVDLSQAENRVVAYIAPEKKMIEAFEEGIDIHSRTAALIFDEPIEKIIEENEKGITCPIGDGRHTKRFWGKKANHGFNYGLGYRTFALYYEITEREAQYIYLKYHEAYPGLRSMYAWIQISLRATRTLTNPFGRKRIFLDRWGDTLFKEAYSFIPQSTVADKINETLRRIYYSKSGVFNEVILLNQVHDSIVFQIPKSLSAEKHLEILREIKRIMEEPIKWREHAFSIPAEFSTGRTLKAEIELDLNNESEAIKVIEQMRNGYGKDDR